MNDPDTLDLESGRTNGWGLRVLFVRNDDRYAHRLQCVQGQNSITLLGSLEGTANQRWPASPPFQQLSVEERAVGSRVALLIGMAGRSHWSASINVAADRPRVEFDVACLVREPPGLLGSTYRLEQTPRHADCGRLTLDVLSSACAPGPARSLRQNVADRVLQVRANLIGEELPANGASQLHLTGTQLNISHACAAPASPGTIRWKYSVELEPA